MSIEKVRARDILLLVAVVVVLALLLFGAGDRIRRGINRFVLEPLAQAERPTASPAVQAALAPTATQVRTPTPTFTPTPGPSPTPTPVPTSALVEGAVIAFWNEFDATDPVRGDWYLFPSVSIENGMMVIGGTDDWDGAYANQHLREGDTVLVLFRYSEGAGIHIAVEAGQWNTSTFRAWGIGAENDEFSPAITEGTVERTEQLTGWLLPGADHWYVLMLYIGGAEPFEARIWGANDPSRYSEIVLDMGEGWAGLAWSPVLAAGPNSILEIDRYEEVHGRVY